MTSESESSNSPPAPWRKSMRSTRNGLLVLSAAGIVLSLAVTSSAVTSSAATRPAAGASAVSITKQPVAVGTGGAVASDDVEATSAGLDVLRHGGNAIDAAVAVAATLGVADPFVAGIGGGGYLVYYNARTRQVWTIDGRETAPALADASLFIDPATGQPLAFPVAVTSGLSVGVPGTLMTWQKALGEWGTESLAQVLRPAERVARQGFPVDSTFRNPQLAATYAEIGRRGVGDFYGGPLGGDIVHTVENLPLAPGATLTPI